VAQQIHQTFASQASNNYTKESYSNINVKNAGSFSMNKLDSFTPNGE
jgi:hypothetical protein